jgi:hypothetical protein
VVKEDVPESTLAFLKQTEISGYVAGSYFYNFNRPASRENTGRGFDSRSDEFMANKFVLRLGHPVEFNAFDWKAGYSAKIIFGQDAAFTQARGLSLGENGDLFEALVTVNAPIGNGVKLSLGKCGSPIGYESTFTEENANWSAGNQWVFVSPFTHTGVMLDYQFNDKWAVKLMVNNGWDVVVDNNSSKSFIANLTFAPSDKTSFALTGFGGPEQEGNNSHWRKGVDFYIDQKLTRTLEWVVQIDYGQEDQAAVVGSALDLDGNPVPVISGDAQWWAAGTWFIYTPGEKWSVALRGDYLRDINGARTSQAPSSAPFEINTGQELCSVTLTLNLKPVKEVRISPELRWDHSSIDTAFSGHQDQITIGFGAAYWY